MALRPMSSCDKATVTMKVCTAACAQWAALPGAGGEVFAAVQSTTACACGTSEEGAAAMQTDVTNKLTMADCDAKCPGDPAQSCGSGGRNTIVRV